MTVSSPSAVTAVTVASVVTEHDDDDDDDDDASSCKSSLALETTRGIRAKYSSSFDRDPLVGSHNRSNPLSFFLSLLLLVLVATEEARVLSPPTGINKWDGDRGGVIVRSFVSSSAGIAFDNSKQLRHLLLQLVVVVVVVVAVASCGGEWVWVVTMDAEGDVRRMVVVVCWWWIGD